MCPYAKFWTQQNRYLAPDATKHTTLDATRLPYPTATKKKNNLFTQLSTQKKTHLNSGDATRLTYPHWTKKPTKIKKNKNKNNIPKRSTQRKATFTQLSSTHPQPSRQGGFTPFSKIQTPQPPSRPLKTRPCIQRMFFFAMNKNLNISFILSPQINLTPLPVPGKYPSIHTYLPPNLSPLDSIGFELD